MPFFSAEESFRMFCVAAHLCSQCWKRVGHGDRWMPLALDVEGLHRTLSPTTSKWLNGQWRWFPGAAQSW
jgi:hypothetical protein